LKWRILVWRGLALKLPAPFTLVKTGNALSSGQGLHELVQSIFMYTVKALNIIFSSVNHWLIEGTLASGDSRINSEILPLNR